MLYYLFATDAELHVLGWAVSGIFVCFTIPISLHDMHMHCRYYVSPLQRHMVRPPPLPFVRPPHSSLTLHALKRASFLFLFQLFFISSLSLGADFVDAAIVRRRIVAVSSLSRVPRVSWHGTRVL
jgi:hypothetical protein